MPGFHLMKRRWRSKIRQPQPPHRQGISVPTTTPNAIASGMMDAVCGALMMMHGRLKDKTAKANRSILLSRAAGAARVVQALCWSHSFMTIMKIVDNLVIHGLSCIDCPSQRDKKRKTHHEMAGCGLGRTQHIVLAAWLPIGPQHKTAKPESA